MPREHQNRVVAALKARMERCKIIMSSDKILKITEHNNKIYEKKKIT